MTRICSVCEIQFLPTPNVEGETLCHHCRPAPPTVVSQIPTKSHRRSSSRRSSRTYSHSRHEGIANMQRGGGVLVLGSVITIATYTFARETGGFFVVAWGAILFGAIRFIMGLVQFCRE
ncbi:MAG: hypothetical protein QM760_06895 [Nibricoccus sp.]